MALGSWAILGSHKECMTWCDEEREQAWCRFEDSLRPIVLARTTHNGSFVGAQAVKVLQIQFFEDKVVGQFQFLDEVMAGPGLCNDSCRCSIDKLLMCSGSCSGMFRCNGTCADSTCSASAPPCFGRPAHNFYVMANSVPEIDSLSFSGIVVWRSVHS